jgi:hypothetical protein
MSPIDLLLCTKKMKKDFVLQNVSRLPSMVSRSNVLYHSNPDSTNTKGTSEKRNDRIVSRKKEAVDARSRTLNHSFLRGEHT